MIACLKAGDRAGYREACAAFMARQGPDPTVVWNALAAASLLRPGGPRPGRLPGAHGMAREAAAAVPRRGPLYRHFFSNALGGLLLRAGRVDEAIVRAEPGDRRRKGCEIPTDWAYLALAHARKGGLRRSPPVARTPPRLRADSSASFWDLQELALLRSEAESLLFDAEFPDRSVSGSQPR